MNLINLCKELYPIFRSITGDGVRKSLIILSRYVPFKIIEVPCGKKVFDWVIPDEWNVEEAYILDLETNQKIITIEESNLHIVSYSTPINEIFSFEELKNKLHFLVDKPDAIPYVTSYYKRSWGFCVTYNQYLQLSKIKKFRVVINSNFNKSGSLTYGEFSLKGKSKKEILFSSYICHPQMCNNELSGPVVLTKIAEEISRRGNMNYSYKFILIPETIGAINYISDNLTNLKKNLLAGFVLTCVGDEKEYSIVQSRNGDKYSDTVLQYALKNYTDNNYKIYSWLDRGSDERQYSSPGVDLPVSTFARSKFGLYSEYHTSLDNFDVISEKGLNDSVDFILKCIEIIETNCFPKVKCLCEPQLGKRDLYPNVSTYESGLTVRGLMNFISYCDGNLSILEIAEKINVEYFTCLGYYNQLKEKNLV
jgi:aminopeptidase-like protein